MTRVVADTNVFISALMFAGLPGALLDLAFAGAFLLVTSSALLDELDEKLRDKFEVSAADAGFIRAKLEQVCELVSVSESYRSSKTIRTTTECWSAQSPAGRTASSVAIVTCSGSALMKG
jgi:putative PIN family toxin of toxin-antitoxin system